MRLTSVPAATMPARDASARRSSARWALARHTDPDVRPQRALDEIQRDIDVLGEQRARGETLPRRSARDGTARRRRRGRRAHRDPRSTIAVRPGSHSLPHRTQRDRSSPHPNAASKRNPCFREHQARARPVRPVQTIQQPLDRRPDRGLLRSRRRRDPYPRQRSSRDIHAHQIRSSGSGRIVAMVASRSRNSSPLPGSSTSASKVWNGSSAPPNRFWLLRAPRASAEMRPSDSVNSARTRSLSPCSVRRRSRARVRCDGRDARAGSRGKRDRCRRGPTARATRAMTALAACRDRAA